MTVATFLPDKFESIWTDSVDVTKRNNLFPDSLFIVLVTSDKSSPVVIFILILSVKIGIPSIH